MNITTIRGRQILDSRGNPTVEADVMLEDGTLGRAAVPSGASTGTHEAVELRDGDPAYYGGKGVLKAVSHINEVIAQSLIGQEVTQQAKIDQLLIELDGTPNKGKLGANALLAVSLAVARAAALASRKPLYESVAKGQTDYRLPVPLINIINGGRHAAGSTDIQEFMILPVGAERFSDAVRMGTEVFQALAAVLKEKGYGTTVGDEGGFAPTVHNGNEEALSLIMQAIEKAGFKAGTDIVLGLDVAASELFKDGVYHLRTENKRLTPPEMIDWLEQLTRNYPIISIEDGLDQEDWSHWSELTSRLGNTVQLVGDDLLVTNTAFLKRGIEQKAANAILVKVNQIGTLTEAIEAVRMAQGNKWRAIISHRSGETEDVTIAHLVVGLNTGQIKTGSMSRTDRTAKYNELLRIEEQLGQQARYAGRAALP